jgi:flagellar protein FliT
MKPAGTIENYETLSTLTRELRGAAERGEWERLTEIQRERAALGDRIVAADATAVLDQASRQRKDRLIEQVLADEATVRLAIQSRLAQMQAAIRDGRQELRVLKEYRRQAK